MSSAVRVFPLVVLSLLLATWSGWIRIGWSLPIDTVAGEHGDLMVNSFLASLIFLERAVTFKNKWVLLWPAINALSVIAFLTGNVSLGRIMLIMGSTGFIIACAYLIIQHKHLYYYVFLAAACCLLIGNVILYKTHFYPNAITWWIGFLLFTIVAERLELSRYLPLTSVKRTILIVALAGVLFAIFWPFHLSGNYILAVPIAITSLWLLKYDMARHSIKVKGSHRYSGWLLIVGYVWLLIMSVLLLIQRIIPFNYDAILHSFFIGFVFSMIFSHAPIILPAVTKLPIKIYRPVLYLWFFILQASLLTRIIADLLGNVTIRKWSGMINGISILCFFVTIVFTVRQELTKKKQLSTRKVVAA